MECTRCLDRNAALPTGNKCHSVHVHRVPGYLFSIAGLWTSANAVRDIFPLGHHALVWRVLCEKLKNTLLHCPDVRVAQRFSHAVDEIQRYACPNADGCRRGFQSLIWYGKHTLKTLPHRSDLDSEFVPSSLIRDFFL